MLLMLLAVGSGAAISGSLKWVFERPRPAVGSDLVEVFTSSFPSGHSMLSAVVYLVLGTMLARMEAGGRSRSTSSRWPCCSPCWWA